MIKLKESQILETVLVCPYCMSEVSEEKLGCCGESCAHFTNAYVTNDDIYLADDVEVTKD